MKIIGKRDWDLTNLRGPKELRDILDAVQRGDLIIESEDVRILWRTPAIRIEPDGYASLIVGRHAVAQALAAGKGRLECRVVECTDEVAALCHRADVLINISKLGPKPSSLHILDELVRVVGEVKGSLKPSGAGRPYTAKGILRVLLSSQLGVSRQALFVAESARKKARRDVPDRSAPADIDTLGMQLSENFLADIELIQGSLFVVRNQVTSALRKLKALRERPFPGPSLAHLLAQGESLLKAIDRASPAAVCPFCKGLDPLQESCTHCLKTGWARAEQMPHVPKGLLDANEPKVMSPEGKMVSVDEYLGEPAEEGAPELDATGTDEMVEW